jgi:hypothetical protein
MLQSRNATGVPVLAQACHPVCSTDLVPLPHTVVLLKEPLVVGNTVFPEGESRFYRPRLEQYRQYQLIRNAVCSQA